MNRLISVIVPVYNVEKYLNKCVESIVNQTYTNLEIILVDDGSPDNCPQMCDEWAEKDSRIKVIHKENGGASDSRNAALDIAKGDYITFVDADDYISYECVEILLKALLENNCDMAAARYIEIKNGITKEKVYSKNTFIFNEVDYWKYYYINRFSRWDISAGIIAVWNKIYKKEVFEDIRFPIGRISEDAFIAHEIASKCDRIAYVDKPLYYYVIRSGSVSHSVGDVNKANRFFDIIDAMKERTNYFIENNIDENLIKYAYIDLFEYQIDRYYIFKNEYKNKELYSKVKNDYRKTYQQTKNYNALNNDLYKKRNNLYTLFYINDKLFKIVRKVKRITGNL